MLYTNPTYTLHTEATKTLSFLGEGLGEKSAFELLLCAMGGVIQMI